MWESLGLGKKSSGPETDTETWSWFRLPIPKPGFGCTLLYQLTLYAILDNLSWDCFDSWFWFLCFPHVSLSFKCETAEWPIGSKGTNHIIYISPFFPFFLIHPSPMKALFHYYLSPTMLLDKFQIESLVQVNKKFEPVEAINFPFAFQGSSYLVSPLV